LIARYDPPGRVTPPTQPRQAPTAASAIRVARGNPRLNEGSDSAPPSVYVHVPFCLSPCFYCGCTRVITLDTSKADVYLDRLYREIELIAPQFDRDRTLAQLHFGGGTPNFLDERRMADLLDSLAKNFSFDQSPEREFGIEIDPRQCDPEYVRMLARHGFNRISVGIQTGSGSAESRQPHPERRSDARRARHRASAASARPAST
jgi:oxygen-independent coproporphyrinogen-3 oxidase